MVSDGFILFNPVSISKASGANRNPVQGVLAFFGS